MNTTPNRRRLDLLILEDNDHLLTAYGEIANLEYGLNVIEFNSGLEAISYINSIDKNSKLPLGYLVDMNIKKGVEEQKTSEELVNILKNRNANISNYSFMTAHFSESHDKGVINRTKMPVIIGKSQNDIFNFYHNLSFYKFNQIPKGKIGNRKGDSFLYEKFKSLSLNILNPNLLNIPVPSAL